MTVGGILAVGVVSPIHILVAQGGRVSGAKNPPVEMGGIIVEGDEGRGEEDEGSGAEQVSIDSFQARA